MATLDEIYEAVVNLRAEQSTVLTQLREHHGTLYGNGREGLKERMLKNETAINVLRQEQKYCPARSSWIWTFRGWIALGGFVLAVVGTTVAFVKAL